MLKVICNLWLSTLKVVVVPVFIQKQRRLTSILAFPGEGKVRHYQGRRPFTFRRILWKVHFRRLSVSCSSFVTWGSYGFNCWQTLLTAPLTSTISKKCLLFRDRVVWCMILSRPRSLWLVYSEKLPRVSAVFKKS